MSQFVLATTTEEERMAIPDHGDEDMHVCMPPPDIMTEMISVKSKGPGKRIDIFEDDCLAATLQRKREPGPDLPLQTDQKLYPTEAAVLLSSSNCNIDKPDDSLKTNAPGKDSFIAPSSSDQPYQEEFTSEHNIKSIPLSSSGKHSCLPPRKRRFDSPAKKPIGSPRKSSGKETGLALIERQNPYSNEYLTQVLMKWSKEGVILNGKKFRLVLQPVEVGDILNSGTVDRPPEIGNNIVPTASQEKLTPIIEENALHNLPPIASSLEYSSRNELKHQEDAEKNVEPLDLSCSVSTGSESSVTVPDLHDQDAPLDYSYATLTGGELNQGVSDNISQMGPSQFISTSDDGLSSYRERPTSTSSVDQQMSVGYNTGESMDVDEANQDGLPSLELNMSEKLQLGSDSLMNNQDLKYAGRNSLPTQMPINIVHAIMSLPDDKARQLLACVKKPTSYISPKPQVSCNSCQSGSASKDQCIPTQECTRSSAVPDLFGLDVARKDGSIMQTSSEKIKDKLKSKLAFKMESK